MKHSVIALTASLQVTRTLAGVVAAREDWPVCAWMGWDTRESFWSSTDGTYPACSAACFSQPSCKSFAYTAGDCNLYDVNVQTNINWDIKSPYLFWDRNCEIKFQSCNTKAYQAKFDSYFWSNTLSQDGCTSACLSDSNCKSLAWGNGECYLYNVPTKGNMDGPGNYLFSDVGCFKSSITSTSAPAITFTTSSAVTSSTTLSTTSSIKPTTTTPATTTSTAKTTQASTAATTTKQSSTTTAKTTAKTTSSTTAKLTTTTKVVTTTKASTTTGKVTTTTTKKIVATSTS